MDSIAFLTVILVGVVLAAWFALNEERGSDGALGLLALRGADAAGGDLSEEEETARYRRRTRLTPERRAGLKPAGAVSAYRARPAERPSYRADAEAADEENPG